MAKKILIIDDDPVGAHLMSTRLAKEGYALLTASNGEQGLLVLRREKPELIILDIEMPQMNGYSFLLEMKKEESFANMEVIVQTSHEENRAIFARNGIKHYLVKPVDFNLLLPRIKMLLGE